MFAFRYLKANFMEICEKISFPFFRDSRLIISRRLSRENAWLPQFFFVDSNSPFKDLLLPRIPNLAQKPLYLVDTVLNTIKYLL